jgi:hypothetical protein
MMTRPSRYPVAAFGPELLAALLKGAEARIEIKLKTSREMTMLQQRIHMLRSSMAKEKHPAYTLAQRARTARHWDEPEGTPRTGKPTRSATNFRLVIEPNDIQFAEALKDAGVVVESHVQDVLDDTVSTTPLDPSTQPSIDGAAPQEGSDPYANFK